MVNGFAGVLTQIDLRQDVAAMAASRDVAQFGRPFALSREYPAFDPSLEVG